jgi:hypothetical protein
MTSPFLRFVLLATIAAATANVGCAADAGVSEETAQTQDALDYDTDLTRNLSHCAQNEETRCRATQMVKFRSANGNVRCAFKHVEPHTVRCQWRVGNGGRWARKTVSVDENHAAKFDALITRMPTAGYETIKPNKTLQFGDLHCKYNVSQGVKCHSIRTNRGFRVGAVAQHLL